jgi:hypothetical protein
MSNTDDDFVPGLVVIGRANKIDLDLSIDDQPKIPTIMPECRKAFQAYISIKGQENEIMQNLY